MATPDKGHEIYNLGVEKKIKIPNLTKSNIDDDIENTFFIWKQNI